MESQTGDMLKWTHSDYYSCSMYQTIDELMCKKIRATNKRNTHRVQKTSSWLIMTPSYKFLEAERAPLDVCPAFLLECVLLYMPPRDFFSQFFELESNTNMTYTLFLKSM